MNVFDNTTPHPTSADPALDREWGNDQEVDMFRGVMFFWRYRYLIVAATLVGVVAGAVIGWMRPAEFTGIATVFVNIPRTQNPLAPDALSAEAVDHLANSDMLQSQVLAELREQKLLRDGQRIFHFRTVLYRSTDPQRPYLPLMGLSVVASSPELARDASNVWASALTEEARKLAATTRASAVDFIVNEYPKAAERLNDQERALEQVKRQLGARLQALRDSAALSMKEEQLWSRERLLVSVEEERKRLAIELKEADAAIPALEQELARTPSTVAASGFLRLQEANPVHVELTRQLAEARVRRTGAAARHAALGAQIDETRREAAALRAALGAGELSIENLEREQDIEIAAKERAVESARANFRKLEEQIGDAQIVKAATESGLTLGSPAELPEGPSGPDSSRTVGSWGLGGLVLALFAAWVTDRVRRRTASSTVALPAGRP